jgi:hypothetical protein
LVVRGHWRRLRKDGLYAVSSSKYYLGDQIKKYDMGGTCSTYGDRRGAHRVLVGRPVEGDHLEDLVVDGSIILKWVFKKWDEVAWTGLLRSGQGQAAGAYEYGNEPFGSTKCGAFLD